MVAVVVELRVPAQDGDALGVAHTLASSGFIVDENYRPVPMGEAQGKPLYLVRGTVEEGQIAALERQPAVQAVWRDTPIAPFRAP